ncbi:MAG: hypothetical protein E6I10_05530 [Chloroflexi bacterium]|nr:MAG: hypothetical protein E6I10_05530 [Chloroflexota bacterium]
MIRTGTVLPATLDQALHRCIALASRFGAIRLRRPDSPDVREFLLDLDDSFGSRLRWTLKTVASGTELSISRPPGIARLTNLARRGSVADRQLDRRLRLLPHLASLKIVVIGGGTGLYTTLLGMRDRSWDLTAVISGLKRGVLRHDPKDQLGLLPQEDASLCLVALAPTATENVVLRSLLSHRMEGREWRGAHFGTELLRALEEISGARRAALDAAVELLGVRGRILVALDAHGQEETRGGDALAAVSQADLIVVAPGHLELDLIPVLCCPGLIDAVRESHALKVAVTKIMTAEASDEVGLTSHQVRPLAELIGTRFDVVLANAGPLSRQQLRAYAAAGSYPIQPDVQDTLRYARRVVTEQLAVAGDLARHDPELLGQCLVEMGAEHLLEASEALPAGA